MATTLCPLKTSPWWKSSNSNKKGHDPARGLLDPTNRRIQQQKKKKQQQLVRSHQHFPSILHKPQRTSNFCVCSSSPLPPPNSLIPQPDDEFMCVWFRVLFIHNSILLYTTYYLVIYLHRESNKDDNDEFLPHFFLPLWHLIHPLFSPQIVLCLLLLLLRVLSKIHKCLPPA